MTARFGVAMGAAMVIVFSGCSEGGPSQPSPASTTATKPCQPSDPTPGTKPPTLGQQLKAECYTRQFRIGDGNRASATEAWDSPEPQKLRVTIDDKRVPNTMVISDISMPLPEGSLDFVCQAFSPEKNLRQSLEQFDAAYRLFTENPSPALPSKDGPAVRVTLDAAKTNLQCLIRHQ